MSADPLFCMTVKDVFSIRGRGTVAIGKVERGTLSTGDEIFIQGPGPAIKVTVSGLEMLRKTLNQVKAGDEVGVLLVNITKDEIHQGDLLTGGKSISTGMT